MTDTTSHRTTLVSVFLLTILLSVVCFFYANIISTKADTAFSRSEISSIISLCAIVSFWIVYFNWNTVKIANLRKYLDDHTYRLHYDDDVDPPKTSTSPSEPPDYVARNEALRQRANSNIVSQGIFMTVVSMLVGPILNHHAGVNRYQAFVQHVIPLLAMLTITFLLWSIDLLDTAQNVFKGSPVYKLERMVHFFRGVGRLGSASLRFYGFAFLSVFVFTAMSFYEARFTAIGAATFVYFGYPILFGYKGKIVGGEVKEVEIDKDCVAPMRYLLLGFSGLVIYGQS